MAKPEMTTLVVLRHAAPYAEGDVYTTESELAKAHLKTGAVRLFDAKKDADLLKQYEQGGDTTVAVEEDVKSDDKKAE